MKLIRPGVPVIVSSGLAEADTVGRFTGKGAVAFLQKPYTSRALAAKLHAVLKTAAAAGKAS